MKGQGMRGGRKQIGWKLEIKVASPVEFELNLKDLLLYAIWRTFFFCMFFFYEPGYDLKVEWSIRQKEIGKQKKQQSSYIHFTCEEN